VWIVEQVQTGQRLGCQRIVRRERPGPVDHAHQHGLAVKRFVGGVSFDVQPVQVLLQVVEHVDGM
jgi:hypothetical protein